MTATFEKISSAIGQQQMKDLLAQGSKIIVVEYKGDKVDIIDNRSLVNRLNQPVKGRGVIHTLGNTRFVVSAKYFEQIGNW